MTRSRAPRSTSPPSHRLDRISKTRPARRRQPPRGRVDRLTRSGPRTPGRRQPSRPVFRPARCGGDRSSLPPTEAQERLIVHPAGSTPPPRPRSYEIIPSTCPRCREPRAAPAASSRFACQSGRNASVVTDVPAPRLSHPTDPMIRSSSVSGCSSRQPLIPLRSTPGGSPSPSAHPDLSHAS